MGRGGGATSALRRHLDLSRTTTTAASVRAKPRTTHRGAIQPEPAEDLRIDSDGRTDVPDGPPDGPPDGISAIGTSSSAVGGSASGTAGLEPAKGFGAVRAGRRGPAIRCSARLTGFSSPTGSTRFRLRTTGRRTSDELSPRLRSSPGWGSCHWGELPMMPVSDVGRRMGSDLAGAGGVSGVSFAPTMMAVPVTGLQKRAGHRLTTRRARKGFHHVGHLGSRTVSATLSHRRRGTEKIRPPP